ncbi:MAG: 4-hydroxy-tetrahydrodipicolinate reductase [Cyclobacteriaceae bacterium]|nr:4-hydroxy-tetrahydrodipicolinate reductase [Cyclobacteriaceae bacterium]
MKILLLGYGKMGKTIEKILLERNHTTVKADNIEERDQILPAEIDVAIEFSMPSAAAENITWCLNNNIPVLSGTTGWLDKADKIEKLCQSKKGTFFYASNYSIGVNLFFQLNEKFAQVMSKFEQYSVSIEEIHHTMKLDSPSGTAITLAEKIMAGTKNKNWVENVEEEGKLTIYSKREGDVPGTHTVLYKSIEDSIELKHTAHSRQGFAMGAVLIAEWLKDQKGVLSMKDFLGELMNA